jgi:hypothetical protein
LTTGFFATKRRLAICVRSYDAQHGAPDAGYGRKKIDLAYVSSGPVSNLFDLTLRVLEQSPPRYTFIHSMEPDISGHLYGWGSVNYSNETRLVDAQLGRLLGTINSSRALSNHTALIVCADHGGGGVVPLDHTEADHPLNYTIPFFLWGPGIRGGTNLYALFSNRFDPGTNRIDYVAAQQPIRDGDAGNLALSLLKLPPIPGSFMKPQLLQPR